MSRNVDKVTFGGAEIAYLIERTTRRKTIAITVNPDTSVNVAVPKGTRRTRISEAVLKKSEWILQQQDRFARNRTPVLKKLVSGESLLYLGRQYQLKVVRRPGRLRTPQASMTRGSIVVTVPKSWSTPRRHDATRQALIEWYRIHAQSYIAALTARTAKRLGVPFESVHVREMKTRWGSGGPSGMLRFNWRIIMAPTRLVEYVVAHELCHVVHGDHSRSFWRLLNRLLPDCEKRRMELELTGPKFDLLTSPAPSPRRRRR